MPLIKSAQRYVEGNQLHCIGQQSLIVGQFLSFLLLYNPCFFEIWYKLSEGGIRIEYLAGSSGGSDRSKKMLRNLFLNRQRKRRGVVSSWGFLSFIRFLFLSLSSFCALLLAADTADRG